MVFGGSYRERSPKNVVDEIEEALDLGYDRISFADDVFTLNRRRVIDVCEEIRQRGLQFQWECLGRVDSMDYSTAQEMKKAGCTRIYFGIESGNDQILKLMNKKITTEQARNAVEAAHRAGLEVGAFFILFYPGETDETVLNTLRFATSLPLDYLGLSMPYPLPGTALYERVKDQITREWRSGDSLFGSHVLTYDSDFSEAKMWFGIMKGHAQFRMKRRLGKAGAAVSETLRETNGCFIKAYEISRTALAWGVYPPSNFLIKRAYFFFSAKACMVCPMRRRSQRSSNSELYTKVTSFSLFQSLFSSIPLTRSNNLDPGSG